VKRPAYMFQIHLQIENASSPARYGYTERGIMPQRYKNTVFVQNQDEKMIFCFVLINECWLSSQN